MKARLVPIQFQMESDHEFKGQVKALKRLLVDEAEILEPVPLGVPLPDAEAALFPQLLGDAYRRLKELKVINIPILIITSEFGTVSMWDWEIRSYLRSEGVDTIAPYNLAQTRIVCKGLGVKRELRKIKFLAFQEDPGEGFQADIFKRFYWWEDECTQRMMDKFELTIERRSFKELGEKAKAISDQEAKSTWAEWGSKIKIGDIDKSSLYSALKLYIQLKRELGTDNSIGAMGINCLNESHFCDTTPCLAWNILYEEERLIWGCEGDTLSMLTMYILHKSLDTPIMLTNLYPFLLGQAALKHERIAGFPEVNEPENHVLVAHCGYLGVLPQSFSTEWTLRKKVLAIVDEKATAIDARLARGDITLAKLHSSLEAISVAEGELSSYVGYPGSDCLNGGVLKVSNGVKLMDELTSHHYLLMSGQKRVDIEILAKIFDLEVLVV